MFMQKYTEQMVISVQIQPFNLSIAPCGDEYHLSWEIDITEKINQVKKKKTETLDRIMIFNIYSHDS